MPSFLINALLAGIGLSIVAGPIGSFFVWQRMSYFGDTLSHSALLGLALGFMLEMDLNLATIVCCLTIAFFLAYLQRSSFLSNDALLGILAHSSLSAGLIIISFMDNLRVDLGSYLFGDLLAVTITDLYWIYGVSIFASLAMIKLWRPMLAITVHEELAKIDGIRVNRIKLSFMLLTALIIAIGMKIVGVLLMTAMLIIPAASAKKLSKSPEQMAIITSIVSALSVTGGLAASWYLDTPAGPSIVICSTALFLSTLPIASVG